MKKPLKQYISCLCVGLIVAILVYRLNNPALESLYGRLCDSCFVPGVLLAGWGGLMFFRNQGVFDTLSYGVSSVFRNHIPGASIGNARQEDFTAWRERKAAKRKSPLPHLAAGMTFLIPAAVFLVLYL